MAGGEYDIITVGGGVGGAALAKSMAANGAKVLVLEREREFHDRVRGEYIAPWGAAEASKLGLAETLRSAGANHPRWVIGFGPERDLISSTPQQLAAVSFYHPALQTALLDAAAETGAEIRRGAEVSLVTPGDPAIVEVNSNGMRETIRARLVVGADGRSSRIRQWGKFNVRHDPDRLILAGVLLETESSFREDAAYFILNPAEEVHAFTAPQGNGHFRSYLAYRSDRDLHLHGNESLPRLIEWSIKSGIPADLYANTKAIGPLASFRGADTWVDHPYSCGIAMIGDAACSSDPSWGQGLCLTLRDVRVLRDALLANEDWKLAGDAYANEHDRYYAVVHTCENWFASFFSDRGEAAISRRSRALALIMEDPTRVPDHFFSGPELPIDDAVRQRFFGEV
jgi:menaquinone-9 beta-reductase